MLAWHGQEQRVASAAARRFLGVVGNGRLHVSGYAVCSAVAPDALSLVIFNARPDPGPRVLADLAIGDVQPVVAASLLPDDFVLHDDVAGRVAAVDSIAFIQSIQHDQLVALGFTAPVLSDHALTGSILQHTFPGPVGAVELELRQVFAVDAASDADRILVGVRPSGRNDHPPWNVCPISLDLTDVMQFMDEQQHDGDADQDVAPVLQPNVPPGAGMVALQAHMHANLDAGPGAAAPIVLAGGPQPLYPGPAPYVAPQAFGAPHGVHWAAPAGGVNPAAGVGGGGQAPAYMPRAAAPPMMPPGMPPAGAALFGPGAPVAPMRPPQPGGPLGFAAGAAPLRIDMSVIPNCVRLFAECLPDDMTQIAELDDLVRILTPSGQTSPLYAFIPADDPMARLEYVEHRLVLLLGHTAMPLVRRGSGWGGVYRACRAFQTSMVPAAASSSLPADLSSSFGRSADRHMSAQAFPFAPQSAAQPVVGASPLDPQFLQAIRDAGAHVDQEGVRPPMERPLAQAASGLSQLLPPGGGVNHPLSSVRNLGAAMAQLPPQLQILESADNRNYNASSSAHLASLSSQLNSAANSFYPMAAEQLRIKIGRENPIYAESRATALRSCVSFTLRGKPLSATEIMLTGAGGADLLTPLRAGDVARTRELLMWMDFVVRLFWPVTEILRDNADGHTFFSFTADRIGAMINVENQPPSVVADFVHHRMRALQDAFKRFYAGQLLLRPVYSSSFLTGPDALAALAELSRMQQSAAVDVPQLANSVAAHMRQLGWVPPPGSGPAQAPAPAAAAGVPLAPAPALPKPPKRPRTRPRPAPAAAAPAVASVAVAPIVGAAAAAVPAPVVAAVTNTVGLLNPPAHVGPASGVMMAAFSQAHTDAAGSPRCFNFWRRGACRSGSLCRFSHV